MSLALEIAPAAAAVLSATLPVHRLVTTPAEASFDGAPSARITTSERNLAKAVGAIDVLLGGPPCQGNSDLNNHTRRKDPRNGLYLIMARAAEVLLPRILLVENVPSVTKDHGRVVQRTRDALEAAKYNCAEGIVDLSTMGVPQRRRRHVLLATAEGLTDPSALLAKIGPTCADHPTRTVRWAIEDLLGQEGSTPFDTASSISSENRKRMKWLFKHRAYDLPNDMRPRCHWADHSYTSMYGRLRWDQPAPTITTGFTSMGQGRYVHPARRRTLTPHEAARLQTFPDFAAFGRARSRAEWSVMLGNAVPPLFNVAVGASILQHV